MKIYSDGSVYPNPGNGGWAFIVLDKNDEITHSSKGSKNNTTNNVMELWAIYEAMKFGVEKAQEFTVYSDSTYAIYSTLGTFKKPKKNKQLISMIRSWYEEKTRLGFIINLQWVRSHDGDPGNEAANDLAYLAMRSIGDDYDDGRSKTDC